MATKVGDLWVDVRYDTSKLSTDLSSSLAGAGAAGGRQLDQSLSTTLTRVGTSLGNVGRQVSLGLSLPLVAFGRAATSAFVDFDTAMTQISSLVGINRQQVDDWRDDVKQLGSTYGVAAAEAADALYYVTSSGVGAGDAMGVLDIAAKGAAVGLGTAKTVADVVTSAMNQYGHANMSAADAADVLTVAVREGKREASEMAGAMSRSISLAGSMGISFGELAGTMASLTLSGVSADEASTQINALLTTFQKMPAGAQRVMKAMTGLDYETVRANLSTKGLTNTLRDVYNAFGDNEEVIGQVFGNTRALRGITGMLGEKEKQTLGVVYETTHARGALADATAEATRSASFQLKQAQTDVGNAMEAIGAAVTPMTATVTSGLATVLSGFDKLPSAGKGAVVALGGFAAAAGPLLFMGGSVMRLAGNMGTAFGAVDAGIVKMTASTNRTTAALGQAALSGRSMAGALAGPVAAAAITAAVTFTTLNDIIHANVVAFEELGRAGQKKNLEIGSYAELQGRIDAANRGIEESRNELARLDAEFARGPHQVFNLGLAQDRQDTLAAGAAFQATGEDAKRLADLAFNVSQKFKLSRDAAAAWVVAQEKLGGKFKDTEAAYKAYDKAVAEGSVTVQTAIDTTNKQGDSFSGLIAAVKETSDSFLGVVNAEKAWVAAKQAVTDATLKVTDAEKGHANAVKDAVAAATKVVDADRKVAQSGLKVAESRRAAADAQRALSDALAGPSIDEKLDLRSAALGVKEAQAALRPKPGQKMDTLERERAKISLERAKQELASTQGAHDERIAEARKDVAAATDGVADAVAGQDDAIRGAADARLAEADARTKVAEAWDAIGKAREGVTLAEAAAVAPAMALTTAQDDLNVKFQTGTAEAGKFRDYLTILKDLYPEVAGSLQGYIDKLDLLESRAKPPAAPAPATPAAPGAPLGPDLPANYAPYDTKAREYIKAKKFILKDGDRTPVSALDPQAVEDWWKATHRAFGGPLRAGELANINERGAPELWAAGGKQYLLPSTAGTVVPLQPAQVSPSGGDGVSIGDIYVQGAPTPVATAYELRRQLRTKRDLVGRR